ncbi:MAG: SIS domain-containing protein [Calditrichaeota bacterium]|nr:MAG: SIS domain-containing protein [Calditrichota bacterium]
MAKLNVKESTMTKFLQEILEQPITLRNTLDFYTSGEGEDKLRRALDLFQSNQDTNIILTGMGSSYFAPYAVSCFLSKFGINAPVYNASELLHYQTSLLKKNTLLVLISQSGESYEIVQLLDAIPDGCKTIAITNEISSTLGSGSDLVLPCKAGKEEMTSTKTFVATILVALILGWHLVDAFHQTKVDQLRKMINDFEIFLSSSSQWIDATMTFLDTFKFIEFIGRGPAFPAAQQSALMVKEVNRMASESLLGGEFRHGPIEMVRDGFICVVFAPVGKTHPQSQAITGDIIKFGGKVLQITDSIERYNDPNVHTIKLPGIDEFLFSIPAIVPIQLIVNALAVKNNIDPGHFVHGAKVTKIE